MGKLIDLTRKRFGKLTAIERDFSKRKRTMWICECDCGNTITVRSDVLLTGHTQSCGCMQKEITSNIKKTHGMANKRLYNIYNNMIRRCYHEKTTKYADYGGRGIKVCDEWKNDKMTFFKWATSNGYEEHLTIDRINNDGNYEPSNCRWVTMKEQAKNKRTNHLVEYHGKSQSLKQWSEELGIKYCTLVSRIDTLQWDTERAFTQKPKG